MENFKPLYDRVLIRKIDVSSEKIGKIYIPDSAAEKPTKGVVVAVGEGVRDTDGKIVPLAVKKGDTVVFGKWSGSELKINNEEYIIMKESDLLGILEG